MADNPTKQQREQLFSREEPVVPFPYQWITANNGERRLVKNIGLSEEQQRGAQGDGLPPNQYYKVS